MIEDGLDVTRLDNSFDEEGRTCMFVCYRRYTVTVYMNLANLYPTNKKVGNI